MPERARTVDLPGRRLAYREAGEGPAALFVHAFPLTSAMWRRQLEALPPGWRGIAPDLRGLGGSRGTPATSVDDHAADLDALLDALSIPSAIVVGLSMGGYVAFALARRRADRVRALVLADTRAEPDTEEGRARREKMQQIARDEGVAAVADTMLPQLLGRSTRDRQPALAEEVRAMALANTAEGVIEALECLKTRPDARPLLRTLTCPTLIVVGQEDTITPPASSEAMAQAIPGATMEVIPEAGHLSSLEQPEAFNGVVFGFFAEGK